MKIGLLTYYGDLNNCGTNLQAYATYVELKKFYPNDEVEIVPIHTFIALSKYMRYVPFLTYPFYHKMEKKYKLFKKDSLGVDKEYLIKDVEEALKFVSSCNYDKIYVGADTLLELDKVPEGYDGLTVYWLKDVNAKKYLIAASSKNVEYESLSMKQKDDLGKAISQFNGIAVRDRATKDLFMHYVSDKDVRYISDPVFTLNPDYDLTDAYIKKRNLVIPPKSVLIHATFSEKWPRKMVQKLHKLGYTVFAPRFNTWADVMLNDMSPLEQFGIYKYFDFVITHRFHDCVFCLKNNVPALIYIKDSKELSTAKGDSKHVSLLKDFGLYPQGFCGCCDENGNLDFDVEKKIASLKEVFDTDAILEKISQKKKEYEDYLKSTL